MTTLADRQQIARRFKQARAATDLNLVAFANRISDELERVGEKRVSKNIVVKIEKGRESPSIELARAWSAISGESPEFLLLGDTRVMGLSVNPELPFDNEELDIYSAA